MSNNLKPTTFLFYFGTAILLSLILVTVSINLATAQDDDDEDSSKDEDKEEEEESSEEQEQDQEESESDKAKELLEQEKKELEELEEQKEVTEELNETTQEQQVIQQQLNDLLANNSSIDQILNSNDNTTLQPVVNTPQEPSTVLEQPVAAIEKQFNATCNCFATTNVPEAATITKTPTTAIPQQSPQEETGDSSEDQQIPITNANIKNSQSFGQVTDPAYTGFYTVSNLLDNTVNDISFWSQAGKSSFYIELDSVMDNYQVCSAELIAHNPKNTPYLLDVGVSKNYTGIIDQMNEKIQFDKCVKNMDEIFMMFDSPDNSYVSLAEIQFFGKKLNGDNNNPAPQPDPTIPKPQPAPYKNMTKINISNSEAEINIQNSTVTFRFDPQSAKATGYNIITIPNAEVVN